MTLANTGLEDEIIRERATLLYADDIALEVWNTNRLLDATQHLCNLFCDYIGLKPNTRKTEVMIFHPGEIWDWCSMEGYKSHHEGSGDTYHKCMCR